MSKFFLLSFTALILSACSNPFSSPDPTPTPAQETPNQSQIDSVRQELQEKTGRTLPTVAAAPTGASLPDGAVVTQSPTVSTRQEIVLQDLTSSNATGFATREYRDGAFELTVLADLPQLPAGQFYQAWILRGQPDAQDFNQISLNRLISSKGGYVLDYRSNQDLTDHQQIIITRQSTGATQPETRVLNGTFN